MKIVFVGGVHGSGKGRLCAALAPRIHATHQVASALLKRATKSPPNSQEPEGCKSVADVRANQEVILRAIAELRGRTDRLLLDGHFCLVTTNKQIQNVPVHYFGALAPTAMLLVEATESEVQRRLKQRDQVVHPVGLLAGLAQCERAHAYAVSQALSVPLKVLSEPAPLAEALAFLNPLL